MCAFYLQVRQYVLKNERIVLQNLIANGLFNSRRHELIANGARVYSQRQREIAAHPGERVDVGIGRSWTAEGREDVNHRDIECAGIVSNMLINLL